MLNITIYFFTLLQANPLMLKQKISPFVLLFLLLLTAKNYGQSGFSAKEIQIRKIMMSNPEQAKTLVRNFLNSTEKRHDTTSVNMYVYYGFAHNLLNAPDSAIYYYKKALGYADKYPKSKAKVYLNLGISNRKLTKYDTALKYLKLAEILNKEISNKNGLGMVYGEIASVYNQQFQYEKSIDYLLEALDLFKQSNKPDLINPVKQRLAGTYVGTQNYVFAADLYADVLSYFKTVDLKNYYVTLVNYGECFYFIGNYTKAKSAINEALPGLDKFKDTESKGIALCWLGAIAFKEKDFVKGEAYYDKGLKMLYEKKSYTSHAIFLRYITDLNANGKYDKATAAIADSEKRLKDMPVGIKLRADLEEQKSITYKSNDAKDKSIASLEKALVYKDSINLAGYEEKLNKQQAQYQNELQRKKNIALAKHNKFLALKVKSETQKKIILIGLFVAALAIMTGGYIFYRFKRKLENEKIKSMTMSNALIAQQYENEQESNRQLKKSLLEKQSDLMSGAMRLAGVQENINEMLVAVKEKEDGVDAHFLTKKLETLIKQEDYWEAFEKKFSEAHPHFRTNLLQAYPDLNKTDLFFASLLKLKLPYKDIGRLMAISPESVVKRKYRLKKKMHIEAEEMFDKILLEMQA